MSASSTSSRELWFTWRVINISLWTSREDKYLESPVFNIAGLQEKDERKFCFRLYPRKFTTAKREFSVSIVSQTEGKISFARYVIYVQHPSINDYSIVFDKPKSDSNNEVKVGIVRYGRGKYDQHVQLTTLETLIIKCSLNKPVGESLGTSPDPELTKLSDDLFWLLDSGEFSDVEIHTEGKSLKAHRIVLHARCPELLKEMKEPEGSATRIIKSGLKASVMREMLKYLYSGKSNVPWVTTELCVAAIQYNLKHMENKLQAAASEMTATTEISTVCKTFEWNILDFSTLQPKSTRDTISSVIFPISDGGLRLTLTFGSKEELQITIRRVLALADKPLTCTCFMYHVDAAGNRSRYKFAQHSFESDRDWLFPNFMTRSSLLEDKKLNLPDDTLTIKFQFTMSEYGMSSKLEDTSYVAVSIPQQCDDLNGLSNDYEGVISKPDVFSDISLTLKDEVELHAHKAILFARSEIFRKKLKDPEASKGTEVLDMSSYLEISVRNLLNYIYTGKCTPSCDDQDFKDLYALGLEFGVRVLQEESRIGWIHQSVKFKRDRALEILPLAHTYNDKEFLSYSYRYILEHSDDILHSNKWMDFLRSHPQIANDMFIYLAKLYFILLEMKQTSV